MSETGDRQGRGGRAKSRARVARWAENRVTTVETRRSFRKAGSTPAAPHSGQVTGRPRGNAAVPAELASLGAIPLPRGVAVSPDAGCDSRTFADDHERRPAPESMVCPHCGGCCLEFPGDADDGERCHICKGTGRVHSISRKLRDKLPTRKRTQCPECKGACVITRNVRADYMCWQCETCHGDGTVEE